MVHGPRAKCPRPGGSENLLLGLRDPSSVMDGWQLDVDGSRLPWWAYPIQHQPDGDHVARLGGIDGLPGDGLSLAFKQRLDGDCSSMTGSFGAARWVAGLSGPETDLI